MSRADVSAGYRKHTQHAPPEVGVWLPLWRDKKTVMHAKIHPHWGCSQELIACVRKEEEEEERRVGLQ